MILILFGIFIGWNSNQTVNYEHCKKQHFISPSCEYSKTLHKLGKK